MQGEVGARAQQQAATAPPAPPATSATLPDTALGHAARAWLERGYVMRYQDASLIELAGPVPVRTYQALLLAFGAACAFGIFGLLGASAYLWHRSRRQRLLSFVLTPEQRVLVYRSWLPALGSSPVGE